MTGLLHHLTNTTQNTDSSQSERDRVEIATAKAVLLDTCKLTLTLQLLRMPVFCNSI